MSFSHELSYATDLARAAGRIVLQHFGQVERLTKGRHAEAVTVADRATQRFIVAGLKKEFPADGFVGEESDTGDSITFECPDPGGRVWVIDPIDGTNNFVGGLRQFAVCIGLLEAGMPVLGVVYDVCADLMYCAARGQGMWVGQQRASVSPDPLDASSLIMLTANLLDKQGRLPEYARQWLSQTVWKARMLGSAALEAAQVAAGVAHFAITVNGKLWDCAAPAALVLEAGGVVSDLQGKPIFPFDLAHYSGAKVPYLSATPLSHPIFVKQIADNP